MLNPHIQLRLSPTADPRLIATNTLIHYSTVELEQAISRELDENPALELAEHVPCPICGRLLSGNTCALCSGDLLAHNSESLVDDNFSGAFESSTEDELDAFWATATPKTLAEYLLEQLQLILDEREQEVALHIVGDLDEHGYFTSSPEELAQTLQIEVSQVQRVLNELQDLDPPGIGARTVEECLLLQLQRLECQNIAIPTATRAIIRDHFEALGHLHFEQIRHALGISREEIEEAFLFIRTNLHPYPANHYYGQDSDSQPAHPQVTRPSILIHRRLTEPHSYEAEVVESHHRLVHVNPLYQQLRQLPQKATLVHEREHVIHFLDRARFFIGALQRRHNVLQQLATYLVTAQCDFLEHGSCYLHPLTQTSVAKELGIHPSTVSRATAGKFAQLPSQALLPLQCFFAPETRAQDRVHQIILQETSPLSDEQIARCLLAKWSITVSRQMIANYRADLKIPAARQRALLQRRKSSVE